MADFPVKKFFKPIFSRSIEHDKCQETIFKGLEGILTFILQLIRSILWDLRDQ